MQVHITFGRDNLQFGIGGHGARYEIVIDRLFYLVDSDKDGLKLT